jgi:AcrR family transcriptional regulator
VVGTVTQRREARIATIVDAAWALAREHGIAGLSLHAVAREVGIRQPSLYEYFASKHALYDAMFAAGNRELLDEFDRVKLPSDSRAALKKVLGMWLRFALADPARCELLFERHVPGFSPSPESYALAEQALGRAVACMHAAGVSDQDDIDCLVAMTAGLLETQMANDPGGNRWSRHLNRLVDLLVDDAIARSTR